MQLKICEVCKRPFLAKEEFCPRCPRLQYEESWASLGCLISMFLPLVLMLLFWVLLFFMFALR